MRVVVGIGVNVQPAAYPPDIAPRATSLEVELSRAVDRPRLVVEIAGEPGGGDRPAVGRRLARGSSTNGGGSAAPDLAARRSGGMIAEASGRARPATSTPTARSLVDTDGRRERLVAGEVTWERLIDE